MSLINKYTTSKLGLVGNGIPEPAKNSPAWGFLAPEGSVNPKLSKLHNEYSLNTNPNVSAIGFNKEYTSLGLPTETTLDPLDVISPKLTVTGVVSQAYNSSAGNGYKQKGPAEGRY